METPPEEPADRDEQRIGEHDEEGQDRIDHEHDGDGPEVEDGRLDHVHESHSQEKPHTLNVVHRPRHEIARPVTREVGLGEPLKMGEEVVPNVVLHLAPRTEQDDPGGETQAREEDRGPQEIEDRSDHIRLWCRRVELLDDVPHGERNELERSGIRERQQPPEHVAFAHSTDVEPEPLRGRHATPSGT